jgi:hypothetical protein
MRPGNNTRKSCWEATNSCLWINEENQS